MPAPACRSQHHLGYVDRDAIPVLADVFNSSVAEVHGVISFYKDFRTTKPAGPIVQVCRAEACQARGANGLLAKATEHRRRRSTSRSKRSSASATVRSVHR